MPEVFQVIRKNPITKAFVFDPEDLPEGWSIIGVWKADSRYTIQPNTYGGEYFDVNPGQIVYLISDPNFSDGEMDYWQVEDPEDFFNYFSRIDI